MTDRELFKMALDSLIETMRLVDDYGWHLMRGDKDAGHAYKTIEALRARLAEDEIHDGWYKVDAWVKEKNG